MKTIELFYLGDEFYALSKPSVGLLYDAATKTRYDWGFIQNELERDSHVHIRPPTEDELKWAYAKLDRLKAAEEKARRSGCNEESCSTGI